MKICFSKFIFSKYVVSSITKGFRKLICNNYRKTREMDYILFPNFIVSIFRKIVCRYIFTKKKQLEIALIGSYFE